MQFQIKVHFQIFVVNKITCVQGITGKDGDLGVIGPQGLMVSYIDDQIDKHARKTQLYLYVEQHRYFLILTTKFFTTFFVTF